MQTLMSRFAHRPDDLHREVAALVADYEQAVRKIRATFEEHQAARFGKHPRVSKRPYRERLVPRPRRPGDKKRPDAGGVTVKPDKPLILSGGAAAALEFE
ncbi:hypothetical protein V6R86_10820 [Sphingomonas kaistensis]|uniref:Transposase n=1 Tax=Sphingomonas kaistensis TaxID=298708 RepID=A0ABZ2G517_9SPHN